MQEFVYPDTVEFLRIFQHKLENTISFCLSVLQHESGRGGGDIGDPLNIHKHALCEHFETVWYSG